MGATRRPHPPPERDLMAEPALATAASSAPARPARRRRLNRDTTAGILMSLPAVAGLIAFIAVPFIAAIVLSLFNVQVNQVRQPTFVGLNQYIRLFTDPVVSGTVPPVPGQHFRLRQSSSSRFRPDWHWSSRSCSTAS